jgi:hypothetical protein
MSLESVTSARLPTLVCALLPTRLRTPTDDHPAAALWWRILDQVPAMCRTWVSEFPTLSKRVGTLARDHSTTSHPGRARRPPPAFGASR